MEDVNNMSQSKKTSNYTGIVVSFEGTDGSGKSTQVAALKEKLSNLGYKVRNYKFPTYGISGKLAFAYLANEEIDSASLNGYQAASLYLVDMMCYAKEIKEAVDNGEVVIIDRYVGSNYYQQAVRSLDIKSPSFEMQLRKFIHEIDQMAYYMMKIYRPDITFFMNVSPEFSRSIRENDPSRVTKDFHEKDEDYLFNVSLAAKTACSISKWKSIDCDYRAIKDISENVFEEFNSEVHGHSSYYKFNFE